MAVLRTLRIRRESRIGLETGPVVRTARIESSRTLASWDLGDEVIADVLLVVSELVTNAHVHGRAPALTLALLTGESGNLLRVDVHDAAPVTQILCAAVEGRHLPEMAAEAPDGEFVSPGGRGLAIVRSLASGRVELIPHARAGKTIRADLPLPAEYVPPANGPKAAPVNRHADPPEAGAGPRRAH